MHPITVRTSTAGRLARRLIARPDTPVRLFSALEPLALLPPLAYLASTPSLHADAVASADLSPGPTLACFALLAALLAFGIVSRALDRSPSQPELALRACLVLVTAAWSMNLTQADDPLVWWIVAVCVYPIAMRLPATGLSLALSIGAYALLVHDGWLQPSELISHLLLSTLLAGIGQLLGTTMRSSQSDRLRLQRSGRRLDAVASQLQHVVMLTDARFQPFYVNPFGLGLLGVDDSELRHRFGPELVHPDDRAEFAAALESLRTAPRGGASGLLRLRHGGDDWRWVEWQGVNLLNDPMVDGIVITAADVTERVDAEQRAARENALLRTVLETLPEGVVVRDLDGRHQLANPAFLERTGRTEDEVIGRTVYEVFEPALAEAVAAEDRHMLESGQTMSRARINRAPRPGLVDIWTEVTKVILRNAHGEPYGLVGIGRDVTAEERAKRQLEYQAGHDALTGLPNRRTLLETLAARGSTGGCNCAVLYIDLDFFKTINDQFGHEVGDRLLIEVSNRVRARLDAADILARLGGDEFVALLGDCRDERAALERARGILDTITEPIPIGETLTRIEASVGVALVRPDGFSAEGLLRAADIAMYAAKEQGRNQVALFDETLRASTARDAGLTQALQFALDRGELRVVYQPRHRLRDRRLEGFEALLRWDSPEFGAVSPMEFIGIAERSALIRKIGRWVLREACRQFRCWLDADPSLAGTTIGVNVSMRQLLSEDFVGEVEAALTASGLPASAVELEITETAVMGNPLQAQATLVRLKALGVRIALDDFGTGYSSLAYVRRLPLGTIKIDRAFVCNLDRHDGEAEIVRLVLTLAKTLGLRSVAEGIETDAVYDELCRLGCDGGQGYLFGAALAPHEVERALPSLATTTRPESVTPVCTTAPDADAVAPQEVTA